MQYFTTIGLLNFQTIHRIPEIILNIFQFQWLGINNNKHKT